MTASSFIHMVLSCVMRCRVEGLQAFHRLQPEWRGRVVQAQQVGREIHNHVAVGRVVRRHAGEDAREERRDNLRQQVDRAGLFTGMMVTKWPSYA